MGYNAIDLIDRCIQIENIEIKYLEQIIETKKNEPTIQIMCKVFLKDCINIICFYDNLKEKLNLHKLDEIHIMTYDKISFLFNEFLKKMYVPDLNSPRKILLFALSLAEDKHSLFIDIQGRLYNDSKDNNNITYRILTKIIEKSKMRLETIKKTLP